MPIDPVTTKAGGWLWNTFGEKIKSMGANALKDKWQKVNWSYAEEQFRSRVHNQLSTVRLLGYPSPIDIESIYTDVHVLNKLRAKQRFNIEEIKGKPIDYDPLEMDSRRMSALEIVNAHKRTYILGKPGAGKTTFLKHLAILACRGSIISTPIYISLKELSDSQKDLPNSQKDLSDPLAPLLDFICAQFNICGFPDARVVVEHILETGKALVLLDGLDEVRHDESQRFKMLQQITNFSNKYPESSFCLTCRIAADEYTFNNFTYVEIADFNQAQQKQFIKKWFSLEISKLELFLSQWNKSENEKIRDLGKTPLLLTLICLAFDETLQFSKRRVDLYTEAVDALLKKWDSSRAIVRGDIYKQLESVRKKQLLSFVAFHTFLREEYLIRRGVATDEIKRFISNLPFWDIQNEIDADLILQSIESHHGLLVERAQNIYSFSHLTIQEYFTALYILDNVVNGSLDELLENIVRDIRWREVMLMCASMQGNATKLMRGFAKIINGIFIDEPFIIELFKEAKNPLNIALWKQGHPYEDPDTFRGEMINSNLNKSFECAREIAGHFTLIPEKSHMESVNKARGIAIQLKLGQGNHLSLPQSAKLANYLSMTLLFIECLKISSVENRKELEEMVLIAM